MKKTYFHTALLSTALLASTLIGCKKDDTEVIDDFSVTADKASYKSGDTATFSFSGNPQYIVFFSGEAGKNFDNRDRLTSEGKPKLFFQSNMTQGVLTNPDSLRLYISGNLKGYDSASVVNATWTEITNRNTKWPTALSSTFVSSDSIDLSDFNGHDAVNIAFRATGKKYTTAAQRKWQIQGLTLTNFSTDGATTPLFSSFNNTGWVQANIKNNPAPNTSSSSNFHAWNVGQAGVNALNSTLIIGGKTCNANGVAIQTAYPITFDPGTAVNVDDNDDWLITSAINLKTVKPDVGITIKRATDVTLKTYRYRFATPGTYTATFVAQKQTPDTKTEVIKQITITVTP